MASPCLSLTRCRIPHPLITMLVRSCRCRAWWLTRSIGYGVLDTGSPGFQPTTVGGPKLVCVDLSTDTVVQAIVPPREAALDTTYLNDIRFDLRRGEAGTAFITDSSDGGANGIVVVDLALGEAGGGCTIIRPPRLRARRRSGR